MLKRKVGLKRYSPAARRSSKQRRRIDQYNKVKGPFLDDKVCVVCGKPATQVHHGKGKTGDLLFDTNFFIPVCSNECHDRIETHPEEAKKNGVSYTRH